MPPSLPDHDASPEMIIPVRCFTFGKFSTHDPPDGAPCAHCPFSTPPAPSLRQASRSHFVLVASRSQVIGNKWGMRVTYLRLLQNDYDKGPVLAWSHAPHRRSSVALSIPHQRVPPLVGWLRRLTCVCVALSLSRSLSLSGHSDALDELGLNRCCF